MERKDAEAVVSAVKHIQHFNEKYGQPHGENPMGIVIEALKVLQKSQKKEVKCQE